MEEFDRKVCGCIYDSKAWLDLVLQLAVRFTPHEAGFTLPILKLRVECAMAISSISAVSLRITIEHRTVGMVSSRCKPHLDRVP